MKQYDVLLQNNAQWQEVMSGGSVNETRLIVIVDDSHIVHFYV